MAFPFILFSILVISCATPPPDYKKTFSENNLTFQSGRSEFEEIKNILISQFKDSGIHFPLNINLKQLDKKHQQMLEKWGIDGATISYLQTNNCKDSVRIIFNVYKNWNIEQLRMVQIHFSPCDTNTKRNFHFNNGRHQDIWGQGDGWAIYSDTDLL